MDNEQKVRIALVYPGDYAVRTAATPENNRFAGLFQALADLGLEAEPAVYHPDFSDEVYQQLLQVDAVLVWVNPIQDGHDRTVLDGMLRQVSDAGVFVSAHPDLILKMGTKEILYQTRHLDWGSDMDLYTSFGMFSEKLPARLSAGEIRVLKQNRGQSGSGVWKVEAITQTQQDGKMRVRARHAERGNVDQEMALEDFLELFKPYFAGEGKIIDQIYQPRLPEGMIRCYLVHDKVAGFGHQAINALYPTPEGGSPEDAPQPGPRLYHPPDKPEFQALKNKLEQEWMPEVLQLLDLPVERLPIIWDADFLLGPQDQAGNDTYVLCEINVSSVAPYPDSTIPVMAQAALIQAQLSRQQRHR